MKFKAEVIWAVTCDFQQCGILTSVDSDEPVQPPFKLRVIADKDNWVLSFEYYRAYNMHTNNTVFNLSNAPGYGV